VRIVWDEIKRRENLRKHRLDFAVLTAQWFADARIEPAKRGRWMAIGRIGSTTEIAVVFSTLGREAISVISMRPASRRERSGT
jgi:uncharacterized DUF497 family protein